MQGLGCTLVAASDAFGALRSDAGLDADALADHVRRGGRVADFEGDGASEISPEELLATPCEVFIPAALGGMIHGDNAELLDCRMVLEVRTARRPHGRTRPHECAARARQDDAPLRVAAYALGIERVLEAAQTRGYV